MLLYSTVPDKTEWKSAGYLQNNPFSWVQCMLLSWDCMEELLVIDVNHPVVVEAAYHDKYYYKIK